MEILVLNEDQPGYTKDDIILVRPDGWPWTEKERKCTRYRIVKLAGDSKEYAYLERGDHPDIKDARLSIYKYTDVGGIESK